MDISYTAKRWSCLLCFPNVDGDRFCCCSLNAFYNTCFISIKMKLQKRYYALCLLTLKIQWFLCNLNPKSHWAVIFPLLIHCRIKIAPITCDISGEYPYGTSLEMGSSRRLRADRVLTIDRPVEYSLLLHPNPG